MNISLNTSSIKSNEAMFSKYNSTHNPLPSLYDVKIHGRLRKKF